MCTHRSDKLPSSLWKTDKSSCFDEQSREREQSARNKLQCSLLTDRSICTNRVLVAHEYPLHDIVDALVNTGIVCWPISNDSARNTVGADLPRIE